MKKYILYTLLLLGLCLSGCEKQEQESYNRQLILDNVGNNIIIPQLKDLQQQASLLATAGDNFSSTPTTESLTAVQTAWKNAVLSWEKCIFFNFGPLKTQDMVVKIDFNPARTHIIESVLADVTTLDQAYIPTLGAAAKGFPALEYLLFDRSKDQAQLLALFTSGANTARRKTYVKALTENIQTQVAALLQEWVSEGNNYIQAFVNNSQGGNDAVNTLANKMIEMAEIIANTKLGGPLGIQLKDGTPQPQDAEAWRSNSSVAHLLANLEVLAKVFAGTRADNSNGDGFDDYLDALKSSGNGQSLSTGIAAQIEKTKQAVTAIQPSVYEAVTSNSAQVKEAYDQARQLTIMIKIEMMNALGGIVTFNDNDGD